MTGRLAAALAALPMFAPAVLVAAPAAAAGCVAAGTAITSASWAQRALDPDQVAPFSTGVGVTVAVVDSGVDGSAPPLSGHVASGTDLADGFGTGDTDCAGHGTQVAGVIAAQRVVGTGFRGLAPGTQILPVKVVPANGPAAADGTADPALLARGVSWAAAHGAGVIAVSLVSFQDSTPLRAAVEAAIGQGIVVVAPAGDRFADGDPVAYPAAYPGVLGVGAVGPDGSRWPGSESGSATDLVAPGVGVVTTQAGGGLVTVDGTAVAAGYVAAAVALVRARWPSLDPAGVARRLEATAGPVPADTGDPSFGYGMINPYEATVDALVTGSPRPAAPHSNADRIGAPPTWSRSWTRSRHSALAAAGVVLGSTAVLLVAVLLVPRGRRRRWLPGLPPRPTRDLEPDLPSPPRALFDDLDRAVLAQERT